MLASSLLLLMFVLLIVWGLIELTRSLFGDDPHSAPEASTADLDSTSRKC